jgi:hypothetical protein
VTLEKGDRVLIHNSTFARDLFVEGKATLIRKISKQRFVDNRELWFVQFEDGEKVQRFVSEADKVN